MHDIEKLRKELLDKLRFLRNSHEGSEKPSIVSLLSAISKYACEEKIKYLLEKQDSSESGKRFDPYYQLKSDFATLKILELLKSKLLNEGLNTTISTEVPSDVGRYDIAVTKGNPSKVYSNGTEKVRIEVKASLGLDFEQLDRYLWDPSPIILVRVITGHVVKLEPSKLKSYVLFTLNELSTKVDRLISGNVYIVPGKECNFCNNVSCQYNHENRLWKTTDMVTMSNVEFGYDLNLFFHNLSYVAERTASLIVEELGIKSENPI